MSHVTISIPDDAAWQKATASVGQGACFELVKLPGGEIAVRNSNRQSQGVLTGSKDELAAFLAGAKAGDFDDLIA